MINKKSLILVLMICGALVMSPSFAKKSKKDFFVIDGTKYVSNPQAVGNTSVVGSDQAIIQLKSFSEEVSSAIIFDLSAGDDFSSFKKGTKIDILNEISDIPDDFDEDFEFPDEAVLLFSHNFLEGNEAVAYSNDAVSYTHLRAHET